MKEIDNKICVKPRVFEVLSVVTLFLFLQVEGEVLWH